MLRLATPAWEGAAGVDRSDVRTTPEEIVAAYSTKDLRTALEAQDMIGPAAELFKQGVDGADFMNFTETTLVNDVKVTPFLAKKLLRTRAKVVNSLRP